MGSERKNCEGGIKKIMKANKFLGYAVAYNHLKSYELKYHRKHENANAL